MPGWILMPSHFLLELLIPAARAVANARQKHGMRADESIPSRIIFPRCGQDLSWRDEPDLSTSPAYSPKAALTPDSWVLRTMFPGITIEDQSAWHDWARSDVAYIFDQVVIVDRCMWPLGGGS